MKEKLLKFVPYILIVLTIVAVFGKVVSFDYVWLDDDQQISKSYSFNKELSNLPKAFLEEATLTSGKYSNYYRPLFNISLILDAQFCGKDPGCYHFTQILLHMAFTLLFYTLLLFWKVNKWIAFIVTLIFTVHPAIANNLGLITGKTDLILAVFFLLSFLLFLKWYDKPQKKYLLLHFLFFNFAIYSKESGFFLIPLIIYYLLFVDNKNKIKQIFLKLIPLWTISLIIWILLRANAIKIEGTPLSDQISFKNLSGILIYIDRTLPWNLSNYPITKDANFLSASVVGITLILCAFIYRKKTPLVLFGIFWFFLHILTSVFQPEARETAVFYEQRFYVALAGIFIAVAYVLSQIRYKKVVLSILVFTCFGFTIMTTKRLEIYKNPSTFWREAVNSSPSSAQAHVGLANAYFYYNNDPESALPLYQKAIEIDPNVAFAHSNLGVLYLEEGKYKDAEEELLKELELRDLDDAWLQLGRVYYSQRDLLKALVAWQKAYDISPYYLPVNINLALVYLDMGRAEDAKYYYQRAVSLGTPEEDDRKYLEYLKRYFEN